MLDRIHRLTKKRDFQQIYRRGERLATPIFLIRLLATNRPVTRVGIVMSAKVHKRSTVRNRHKRHVREVVRPLLKDLPTGYDVVITINRALPRPEDWRSFEEELRQTIKRRFSV